MASDSKTNQKQKAKEVNSEIIHATHPRTGDRIINVRDSVIGVRAELVTRKGNVPLAGTWVFAPDLSFSVLDDAIGTKAGISPGYVLIGDAWQY